MFTDTEKQAYELIQASSDAQYVTMEAWLDGNRVAVLGVESSFGIHPVAVLLQDSIIEKLKNKEGVTLFSRGASDIETQITEE